MAQSTQRSVSHGTFEYHVTPPPTSPARSYFDLHTATLSVRAAGVDMPHSQQTPCDQAKFYEHVTSSEPILPGQKPLRTSKDAHYYPLPPIQYQPLPYERNRRYYSHALTEEERVTLRQGLESKPWSSVDYLKHMVSSPLKEASLESPRTSRDSLSPLSSPGGEKHFRRISRLSMFSRSLSPSYAISPRQSTMLSSRSFSMPAPRATSATFDDFLEPHISGFGEAYRGAVNAMKPEWKESVEVDEKQGGTKMLRKKLSIGSKSLKLRNGGA